MKMKSALILAALSCALSGGASDNLLLNGDFSDPVEPLKNWKFETAAQEVYDVKFDPATKSVDIESLGADYSGYLTQFVKVEPNQYYSLSFDFKHLKGRCLIWVIGFDKDKKPLLFDQRKYLISCVGHPLVPDFVAKELMMGTDSDEWRREELIFYTGNLPATSKEVGFVRINLGLYFSTAKAKFKDVVLKKIQPPSETKGAE